MNAKKTYFGLIGCLVLSAGLLLFSAYSANKLIKHDSSHLTSLKAKLAGLQQEQLSLVTDKKDIATYSGLYNIAKVVVPENKDQAQAVRQIVDLANANNVSLASITFPSSSLGNSAVHSGAAPTAPTPSVPSASSNLSQLTAVPNIPGVYELPITIQSDTTAGKQTTYPELIGLLQALENNRLTALVSAINITPNSNDNSHFSFSLQLNIYIKPGGK